jgi:3-oxoacyl-[acyl-carrier protein] reductase
MNRTAGNTIRPVALVTGASRGIGAAIASELGRRGWFVFVNYRVSEDEAREVVESIRARGGEAEAVRADVSDPAAVEALFGTLRGRGQGLDCLVNNAAVTGDKAITRMSEDEFRRVVDTGLGGTWRCCKAAVRLLRKSPRASIVNMGSSGVFCGNPGQSNYAAAKGGVMGLTRSLARELGSMGIRVNCVTPGFVRTGMNAHLPQAHWDAIVKETPLGRLCTPEEIARTVAFFASEDAGGITGQLLLADGGRI